MNSYFNILLRSLVISSILFWGLSAQAVNVMAVYTSACQRHLGTIVRVNDQKVNFLTLSGKTVELRPHQIIYLAYYPIDQLPLDKGIQPSSVDQVLILTQQKNKITSLTQGWPTGFTKDKVAFLNSNGRETLVARTNIFGLKMIPSIGSKKVKGAKSSNFYFIHPYSFSHCKSESPKGLKIYPQQVLSNTIMIKRELDLLEDGYKKVLRYNKEQKFYPVPEVYKNKTSLGLWYSFGSRYGSSNSRTNNLTPVLTDSYSSDVYDYQHIFVTGSAPMLYSIHEEPQTQAYYAFKASYFHFSAMIDPSTILVGKKYAWAQADFDKADGRTNPTSMIEMGFDFGNYTLDFYLLDIWQIGIYTGTSLITETFGVPRLGMSYANHLFKTSFSAGQGTYEVEYRHNDKSDILDGQIFRFNFDSYLLKNWTLTYSYISRQLKFSSTTEDFSNESSTHAGYATYRFRNKYNFGGYLSLESYSQSNLGASRSDNFIKAGAFTSLSF